MNMNCNACWNRDILVASAPMDEEGGTSCHCEPCGGDKQEEYESWRFLAKVHLMTKRKEDDLGVIENEEELATELVTLLEPIRWRGSRSATSRSRRCTPPLD